MIAHREFEQLRLRQFASDVLQLDNWEFMGRLWVGEAIGFTEWLRLKNDPDRLGSVALDLVDLPSEVSRSVLDRLQLPVQVGMSLPDLTSRLGVPTKSQQFVPDRMSYDFEVGDLERYSVSCTVHENDGLIYIVVMSASA